MGNRSKKKVCSGRSAPDYSLAGLPIRRLANSLGLTDRWLRQFVIHLPNGSLFIAPRTQWCILIKAVVEQFCARFAPSGKTIYVGDTSEKYAYFDEALPKSLGVQIELHGKMPDVVIYHEKRNWLVLVEAVTSHGPVNPKRMTELKKLFKGCKAGLVFVTAFVDRQSMLKYLDEISWETEVWVAESPTHLIHFNGERFLGPYQDAKE